MQKFNCNLKFKLSACNLHKKVKFLDRTLFFAFDGHNFQKCPYVLIKDFNTFLHDHTLHSGRKHFCCYCLQAFSTEKILKCHLKDCYKINGKQRIKMPKKDEYVRFKDYEKKKLLYHTYNNLQNI